MIDTEFRKPCIDCKYADLSYSDFPCSDCVISDGKQRWEPQRGSDNSSDETGAAKVPAFCPDEYVDKTCYTCRHLDGLESDSCFTCRTSNGLRGWEPRLAAKKHTDAAPGGTGMGNDAFEALVNELREKSMDTLLKKNARYANDDRLHNFRIGAALIGGTPAQAALGYMAKHLAALIDMVQKDDFSDRDDLLEKCQDIINYIVFIWCCGNEGRTK